MQKIKNNHIGIASFLLLIGFLEALLLCGTAVASDIPIETYIEGGLVMASNGSWNSGISFTTIPFMNVDINTYWNANSAADFIDFADDTTSAGFHITMSMTDFVYTGSDPEQGSIVASNFKLIGEYANGNSSAAGIGLDDGTKTVSILPNSCAGATPATFTLNGDLADPSKIYAITGSNSTQVLVSSTADCLNIGHLRFDRANFLIPAYAAIGSYTSTLTLTIIDGPAA